MVVGNHSVQRHGRHERGAGGQRWDGGAATRVEMFKCKTRGEILGEERGERRYDAVHRCDTLGAQTAPYVQVVV